MPNRVPTHRAKVPGTTPSDRHRLYDRTQRDPESRRFYASSAWRKVRRSKLLADPLCEHCKGNGVIKAAVIVHHVIEVRNSVDHRLDLDNLVSLCEPCHSRLHASQTGGGG